MNTLIPDLLRAVITNVMLVALLYTMSQPKYNKKWIYITATLVVVVIDLGLNFYFYLQQDYTSIFKVDLFLLLIIAVVFKPLFRDAKMQWLFSYVTVLNIYAAIVFLSYILRGLFPNPVYGNAFLRFVLFAVVVFIFWRFAGPLYRKVAEHWNLLLLLTVALLVNFLYYFTAAGDIQQSLEQGFFSILLLVFLEAFLYISIFLLLKVSSDRYDLREEKIKSDARQELLQLELAAQDEFVSMARQNRHDLRHHNALLADYLDRGDVDGAKKYLRQHDARITETVLRQYCKNPVANAVLRLYERRAEQNGIAFSVSADIPEQLPFTAPETGELFSNLLENACEACERSAAKGCFIALITHMEEGRLLLELRNTVDTETAFDRTGLPLSQKSGGGTGTRSMAKIMKKYGGMLRFKQKNDVFLTQIILPPN